MIGGALIVAVCLLVLGWTGEIVRLFVKEPETVGDWSYPNLGVPAYEGLQAKSCTIALAVLSIYAVDFAINAGWCSARIETDRSHGSCQNLVQSSCRSLIVDTLPIAKQQLGSAWGTRRFPAFENTLILRSYSQQDDCNRPSDRLWGWNFGPCQHLRKSSGGLSVQTIDRHRCYCFPHRHWHHVLGCRRAGSDFSKVVLLPQQWA